MTADIPTCIACSRTADEIPLILFQYKGQERWICPQHLPVLIHKPTELAHKLPGIEQVPPVQHDH